MNIKAFFKEMRMHHYIKNLLIFVPLIFGGQIGDWQKLLRATFAFFAFCLISSAIYFINDLRDIEKDRNHPTKRNRPIAAGQISLRTAVYSAILLFVFACAMISLCADLSAALLLGLYFLLNLAYSFGLKDIPLLDVSILVAGFLIRALCGAAVADIRISSWLYLVVISAAFYLGLGKRRSELQKYGEQETRAVIGKYSDSFLNHSMNVCMALVIVFYALWSVDEKTIAMHQSGALIWSVPLVLLIFMRYSLTVERNTDGDPVEVLLHDKVLLGLCGLYIIMMAALLYGGALI